MRLLIENYIVGVCKEPSKIITFLWNLFGFFASTHPHNHLKDNKITCKFTGQDTVFIENPIFLIIFLWVYTAAKGPGKYHPAGRESMIIRV